MNNSSIAEHSQGSAVDLNGSYVCEGATEEEMRLYGQVTWWMDGVVQVIVGLTGLAGNSVAVPVLLSKNLNSIFNRILVFLAAFDNVFIFCSLLEAVRKNFGPIHEVIHVYSFAYFLYQVQSMAIVASIFTTVVLALERCLAVAKPIEYHNATQGMNPWRRVIYYIIPVIIISVIFSIPKFLEIDVVHKNQTFEGFNWRTNSTVNMTKTVVSVRPTDLRMDDTYIFWYNNIAKLLVTGILPFAALCIFNFRIYGALRKRRSVMGPNATAAHEQQLNEDNRQALVLFGIVLIFFVSNVPRILLNIHEVFTIGSYKEAIKHNCFNLPLWVLLSGNISQLLMIMNSSMNFFIYCLMSSVFREVLADNLVSYLKACGHPFSFLLRWRGGCFKKLRGQRGTTSDFVNETELTNPMVHSTTVTVTHQENRGCFGSSSDKINSSVNVISVNGSLINEANGGSGSKFNAV